MFFYWTLVLLVLFYYYYKYYIPLTSATETHCASVLDACLLYHSRLLKINTSDIEIPNQEIPNSKKGPAINSAEDFDATLTLLISGSISEAWKRLKKNFSVYGNCEEISPSNFWGLAASLSSTSLKKTEPD